MGLYDRCARRWRWRGHRSSGVLVPRGRQHGGGGRAPATARHHHRRRPPLGAQAPPAGGGAAGVRPTTHAYLVAWTSSRPAPGWSGPATSSTPPPTPGSPGERRHHLWLLPICSSPASSRTCSSISWARGWAGHTRATSTGYRTPARPSYGVRPTAGGTGRHILWAPLEPTAGGSTRGHGPNWALGASWAGPAEPGDLDGTRTVGGYLTAAFAPLKMLAEVQLALLERRRHQVEKPLHGVGLGAPKAGRRSRHIRSPQSPRRRVLGPAGSSVVLPGNYRSSFGRSFRLASQVPDYFDLGSQRQAVPDLLARVLQGGQTERFFADVLDGFIGGAG